MTSTYDHRVIQGAESGAFLRRIDQLLQGEDGFYESVFDALGRRRRVAEGDGRAGAAVTAAEPVPAAATPAAGAGARRGAAPGRAGGHLGGQGPPHARPPGGAPRPARLRARRATRRSTPPRVNLTPELMRRIPASVLRVAVPGETFADALPAPARHLHAARSPTRSSTSPTTSSASGCARRSSRARYRQPLDAGARARGCSSGCPRSRRSRATCTRPSSARSSSRSRASTRSCRCSTRRSSWPPAAGAREVVLGMAHRGRLNVLAHTVGRPYESILAEFEGEQTLVVDTAAPEGGTGDVKYHYGACGHLPHARRQGRDGHAVAQPEPPRVREPGDRGPRARRPDEPQGARARARPDRRACRC